jgi:hypothetical protein
MRSASEDLPRRMGYEQQDIFWDREAFLKEVVKLDKESITVEPLEVLRTGPAFPAAAMRQTAKMWPDEEEKGEIELLTAFLWVSAIASCLISVILFALVNRSCL